MNNRDTKLCQVDDGTFFADMYWYINKLYLAKTADVSNKAIILHG